jgi:hypothetical protein
MGKALLPTIGSTNNLLGNSLFQTVFGLNGQPEGSQEPKLTAKVRHLGQTISGTQSVTTLE